MEACPCVHATPLFDLAVPCFLRMLMVEKSGEMCLSISIPSTSPIREPAAPQSAEDTRLSMIRRTHGIEGMRRVAATRRNASVRLFQRSIGVPQTHADAAPARLIDEFVGTREFRGHSYLDIPARRFPHALKHLYLRILDVLQRMGLPPFPY